MSGDASEGPLASHRGERAGRGGRPAAKQKPRPVPIRYTLYTSNGMSTRSFRNVMCFLAILRPSSPRSST